MLSMLAASLIVLAPVHALAQEPNDSVSVRNRPRPEYDPAGVRFGGFDLNATLDLGVASTDNLFAVETGEDDDIIYTASPSARLTSHWSRHALAFDAGLRTTSHQDFSSEDATSSYAGASGRLDIGSSSSVSASAGIAHEVEPRTDPDATLAGNPVEYDRTNLSLSAQHTINRFRLRGTIAQNSYEFDGAQNVRDSDETSFTGRIEAELTPRIGVVVQGTTDERDYDNNPGLNSEGQTYLVGATINFTDLLRGEITAGTFNRDYDSGQTVDGTAVAANLDWYITRLTTISANARRNVEDTGATAFGQPYIESQYGARIDHELLRNLILSAGAQVGRREYQAIDRNDDYMFGMLEAQYLVNRRVALTARYQHDENESDGAAAYRDYDVNTLSLGVSLRL